jgi:UDP-glucose 4-epimerase
MSVKIIITGATGFIGSALSQKLENIKGYSVVKITRTKDESGFFTVRSYQKIPAGDVLIHLGENSDRGIVNKKGDQYRKETGKVVEALLRNNYKKVIYCSTSTIYGDKGDRPYSENMEICVNDIYTKAKAENEEKVLSVGGIVIRLSNVIGAKMSKNNVLSDIIKQLPGKSPLTIRSLKPIRDFIWIDDVVDAIVELLQKDTSGVFNIGSGVATSINQLTEIVLSAVGQKNRKVKSSAVNSGYSYNVLNTEKIKKITGWEPKYLLPQSIKKMVRSL